MAHRHNRGRPASSSSVAGLAPSQAHEAQLPSAWPHIEALIHAGGQILIGTLAPIESAAVAHDGKKTLAMLRRRSGEALPDLLARLDLAIATAKSTGSRVDEINTPSSDRRYEI